MPLKPKNPQTPSELPPLKDELSGPWGRINSDSRSFDVVRFCKVALNTQQTHSYPYRVISSWHWTKKAINEELKIEAGPDVVTVQGRGLDRIVEALDRGMLEVLCEATSEIPSTEESPIWITTIEIEGE